MQRKEMMNRRKPDNSMKHYTAWLNSLHDDDLMIYQYREVVVIQPTWMMTRANYDKVGGYVERGQDSTPFPEVMRLLDLHSRFIHRIWNIIIAILIAEGNCVLFQKYWSCTGNSL